MIITKTQPFSKNEINQLLEEYEFFIKTVIDLEKKVCSAGGNMHADCEKILLDQGSEQKNLWGGGINTEIIEIDFNSFINIRPTQNNTSNEILDQQLRKDFENLMKFFFSEIYGHEQ